MHGQGIDTIGQMYLNLVQAIPDIVYVLDDGGRFVYLNEAVSSLGFEPRDLLGLHFSEILHPEDSMLVSRETVLRSLRGTVTGDAKAPKLFDERRSGRRMTRNLEVRLRMRTEPETWRYGSVNAYGEVDSSRLPFSCDTARCTVGIIRDITIARQRENALGEALAERETLLKEIHHRVKNNLQVISSLLSIHESDIEDPVAAGVFRECRTQIQSIALVHETLCRKETLTGVDMRSYLCRLAASLSGVYGGERRGIRTVVGEFSCMLGIDTAMPLALIANELVSNAFKHAFGPGRRGEISLRMFEDEGEWHLVVDDRVAEGDAPGLPGSNHGDAGNHPGEVPACERYGDAAEATGGIGTVLVQALAKQLRGRVERSGGTRGTAVTVRFPVSAGSGADMTTTQYR